MMIQRISTMRTFLPRASAQAEARTVSESPEDRFNTFAVYGAFALIAAIVFGTLSYHPF
jgi:hypothetical protein